jgi:hypothetical protein
MNNCKFFMITMTSIKTNGLLFKKCCREGKLVPINRTQTKIKNYFYGNIRYLLKIIIKNFLKQSTGFINDVKTNILLDMY